MRKVGILFSIHIPEPKPNLARLKAIKFCEKLEGLGFRTFIQKYITTIADSGAWDIPKGSGTTVLAIKAVENRHYRQKFLEDLRVLGIYPQEGIKLLKIGSFKSVTKRLRRSHWLSFGQARKSTML